MSRYLYVGTAADAGYSYRTLWKINADTGGFVWGTLHGDYVLGITATATYVYICGGPTAGQTVRKYSIDGGSPVWSANQGDYCYDIFRYESGGNGYLAVAGWPGTRDQLTIYADSDGSATNIISAFSSYTRSVSVRNESGTNYYYIAGDYTSSSYNAVKTSGSGSEWTADLHSGTAIGRMRLDADGNIYVVGAVVSGVTTRKYNNSRVSQWTANHGATVNCIAIDSSGNVYTGGEVSGGYTTRKYNSSGSLQWSVNHGAAVNAIAVDADGNVYTGGEVSGGYSVRKYSSSGGSPIWSYNAGAVYALCINEETIAVTLAGAAADSATATGRLHVQPLLGFPPSRLAAEMLLDTPELFAPCSEIAMPNLDQRYAFVDQEIIDWSGNGHEILLNGSSGFVTGSSANARYPVPRVAYHGINTATWSGYASPSIKTDIGPSLWDITQAWAVECWTRRYGFTESQYHWYFGNADVYSPVLHHVYVAQGWFEIAGSKHQRVLYSIADDAEYQLHHLVLNYDGSSTLTLYVDAIPVATLSQSIAALGVTLHSGARLYWGQNQSGGSQYPPVLSSFTYAYLALYRHALSSERIKAHYRAGISAAEQRLLPFFVPSLNPHWSIHGSH